MADRLGVVYVELDLDYTKFEKNQKKIIDQANSTALSVEKNYQILGVKSDNIFNAMAQGAVNAYTRIANAANTSAAEQFRAQSAMVAKVNALNQQMTANPLYETLGIKSQAAYKAQEAAIMASYNTIKNSGTATADDLVRIERAKNAKLKELNKEMVGEHEMSMASMTRAVLRFYAAFYVVSAAAQGITSFLMGGVETIDKMNMSAVTVAATITNLQGTSGNITENYKKNLEYAKGLVPVLMQIDAASFANLKQVQLINNAMAMHGVILDDNNKKQVEAVTALTNTIAMYTYGQNKEQQATQETNALLNGEVSTRNRIALMIDQQIKRQGDYKNGLKGLNEEAKKHGDWLERIRPYLLGAAAASGDISKTWEATSSSLQTTWMILQTEIFSGFYKELITGGQELIGWTRENAPLIGQYFRVAMNAVGNVLQGIWGFLKGFAPLARDFGSAVALVAYGWGGVFAVLKPIGEFMGNSVSLTYELLKMLGNAAVALGGIMTLQVSVAKVAWEETKKSWTKVEELSAKNKKLLTEGVADAVVQYDKQYQAAKKAAGAGYVPKVDPAKEQPLKDSVKDDQEVIRLKMQADKAYYDEQVKTAKQVAKLNQRAGQDEYKTIKDLYDAKETALNNYLEIQYQNAKTQTDIEAKAATISKDGVAKKFDYMAVLQAKYDKIYAQYNKDWAKDEGDRAIAIEDANKMTISTMANLYKTIGDYSKESIDTQIEQIKEKYINEQRYASHSKEQLIVLEKAKNTEIFNLRNAAEKKLLDMQLSYLKDMSQEQSAIYRELSIQKIKNEADKLEQDFANAAGGSQLSKEGVLAVEQERKKTELLLDEYKIQLENRAAYLTGMGDTEGASKALAAAESMAKKKEELSNRVLENEIKNQQTMFNKAAYIAEQTRKLDKDIFTDKMKNVEGVVSGFGAMLDAAMNCYDKDSYEYNRLAEWKKGVLIAQQAIEAAKNVQTIAGYFAVQTAASGAAVANAGAAVTGASIGVGPTGFATAAAMIALMASVFAMYGIANSGGSASVTAPALPKSTVLGAADGTASESISKSWELMQDTYNMENTKLTAIYNQLKDLNSNITGLVTNIVKYGTNTVNWTVPEDTTTALGDILSVLGMGKFGEKVAGLVSDIFGGGSTSTVAASGISMDASTVRDLINGLNVSAKQYAYIVTHTYGGWFHSDTDVGNYQYAELNSSITEMFTKVFKNISQTLVSIATGLGMDTQVALNYAFADVKIDLQGMTTDEINETITNYFSTLGDNAVDALFGTVLRVYQQLDEGLYETAVRIITDKETILYYLDMVNNAYSATSLEAIAMSENLISLAGDLDTLTGYIDTYYDKFFSDMEKQTDLYTNLSSAMTALNYSLPDTRAGYRAIVEGLDLMTSSGQSAYVTLMALSEYADTYYSYLEDAAETAADKIADLVDELTSLSTTISDWLASLGVSDLNPVLSEQSYKSQYETLLAAAQAPSASSDAINDYLNYATTFLTYEKSYGTGSSYQSIYDAVVADVMAIQAQNTAILATYGDGGLTSGVSIAGERGAEWVVPTYEPQRSNFLKTVGADTETLGAAIGKYIVESNGGSNGGDIHVSVQIDGKEIGNVVAKQTRTNSDLQKSIRSLN